MDDAMLDAQCRDIARCIEGLSLTLLEAGGGSSISRIIADVHKLIQSFRLLGNYYVSELSKKCKELETKREEVKKLSYKLEQGKSHSYRAGAQKPDVILLVDAQRHVETSIPGDSLKSVEELSMREHDLGKLPGTYIDVLKTLNTKSEELDKSVENVARWKGDLDEKREENFKVEEKVGQLAVSNEFLSRQVMKDLKQLVKLLRNQSNRKGFLLFIASKQLFSLNHSDQELLAMECRGRNCRVFDANARVHLETLLKGTMKPAKRSVETQTWSLHTALATQAAQDNIIPVEVSGQTNTHGNLLSYPHCLNTGDFAQATHETIEIRPGERSRGISTSAVGCDEEKGEFWRSVNESGAIERSCTKRCREFMDLVSDPEQRKKSSNSTPWPTIGKSNDRQNLDLQSSHKINEGTVHGIVTQEQNMVETLCKAMEHYQHEFLEKPLGSAAYNNVV